MADEGMKNYKTEVIDAKNKKIALEEQINNYKYKENILKEQLAQVEKQTDQEKMHCQKLYQQIENVNRQRTIAEVAYISEAGKIESKMEFMKQYEKEFDDMDVMCSEQSQLIKLEEKDEALHNINEMFDIDNEIIKLEKSCTILQKRNAAILLLLRKNVKDSEMKRRALIVQAMQNDRLQ